MLFNMYLVVKPFRISVTTKLQNKNKFYEYFYFR